MEPSDVSLARNESCSVRLHVGGLGPSVTSSDLERTFAALGRVSSVDMVRTKGRNFAYMNFEAASPHDLRRLISLYNGCVWKGGCLKLEKAREHYLDKLHRERGDHDCSTESETLTSTSDSPCLTKKLTELEKSKGLNIFFPKSRQVKMVPQKGLGKHKRSFEHVDSIPCSLLQLCDCKQCCRASSGDQNKLMLEQLELAGKSGRKVCMKTQATESKSTEEIVVKDFLKKYKIDLPETKKHKVCFDTEKVHEEGTVGVPELKKPLVVKVTARAGQKPGHLIENINDNEEAMQKGVTKPIQEARGCADIPPKKQVRFDLETNKSFLTEEKELSEKCAELKEDEQEKVHTDLATEKIVETKELNSATDTVWLQKASWKTLVGETGRISFRLSNILGQSLDSTPVSRNRRDDVKIFSGKSPSISSPQQTVSMVSELKAQFPKMNSESVTESEALKCPVAPCRSSIAGSKSTDLISKSSPWIQCSQEGLLKSIENQTYLGEDTLKHDELVPQPTNLVAASSTGNDNDKVCVFMRSTNSEQEWLESKRIVKEMMKRSRKDALRSIKMLRTPRQNY